MTASEVLIASAASFLEPVLRPGKTLSSDQAVSLSRLLYPRCNEEQTRSSASHQATVALQSLHFLSDLLKSLHTSSTTQDEIDNVLRSPGSRRIVNALIDLLAVEGIHPYLEAGVGVSLLQRMQSSFKRWEAASQAQTQPSAWDDGAWSLYKGIMLLRSSVHLRAILDNRILVDLLPFILQAAYSPSISSNAVRADIPNFLESIGTVKLLPVVSSLLNPPVPYWLQQPLTSIIACAPMRENGVRDTVNFLATTQILSGAESAQSGQDRPQGPLLTNQTLERASQVIAAVPTDIDAGTWFASIGPQLLKLLSSSDTDEQKVASYIAGTVLSRRNVGSPGTSGWEWLALPILGSISMTERTGYDQVWPTIMQQVTPKFAVRWAVGCLSRLLLLHPNPGLVKRLGSRSHLNLWFIACLSATDFSTQDITRECIQILQRFIVEAGCRILLKLLHNFFNLGGSNWEFKMDYVGSGSEVFMLDRIESNWNDRSESGLVRQLESNTQILIGIMKGLDSAGVSDAFVMILEQWAAPKTHGNVNGGSSLVFEARHTLVLTKTLQSMLDNFGSILSGNPDRLLPVVDTILNKIVHTLEQDGRRMMKPNIESLQTIVDSSQTDNLSNLSAMISFALGLLWVLALGNGRPSKPEKKLPAPSTTMPLSKVFPSLLSTLHSLVELPNLPPELHSSARAVLLHLELDPSNQSEQLPPNNSMASNEEHDDYNRYRSAIEDMSSSLAPVRAQGMKNLNELIENGILIAVSSTTVSLLMVLLQEDDEYLYLNALGSIRLIARQRSNECILQLIEAYVDRQESSTLKVRLRLGEAIHKIMQDQFIYLSATLAETVVQDLVAVAGRRSQRTKELKQRAVELDKARREQLKARKEWGGDIPELPEEFREEVTPADERAARIIEKWIGSGREEDLRIRASALSIIGTICSARIDMLESGIVVTIVELASLILQHESGDGAAIVRRAAVLLLRDLVVGIEAIQKKADILIKDTEIFEQVSATLERARDDDMDDVVRGHATEVLKSLDESSTEALRIRLHEDVRTDLGGKLQGLSLEVIDPSGPRPHIEEIE